MLHLLATLTSSETNNSADDILFAGENIRMANARFTRPTRKVQQQWLLPVIPSYDNKLFDTADLESPGRIDRALRE